MRSRTLVAIVIMVGSLAVGLLTSGDVGAVAAKQWAIVDLQKPVRIAGAVAMGSVLVVHDDAKMARGEPCTTVYTFDAATGPGEEIVSFHCKPHHVTRAASFTFTRQVDLVSGFEGGIITAYQFAGDDEVHGIPVVR